MHTTNKNTKKSNLEYSEVWEIPVKKLPNRAAEIWGDLHTEFLCDRKMARPHSPYRLVPKKLEDRQ